MLTSRAVFLQASTAAASETAGETKRSSTYPGSLSVLFIEKAKCLPSEVNSSGR